MSAELTTAIHPTQCNITLGTWTFTWAGRKQEFYKALYTIEEPKATGSDGIHAKALKIAAPHISQVVAQLFSESFNHRI